MIRSSEEAPPRRGEGPRKRRTHAAHRMGQPHSPCTERLRFYQKMMYPCCNSDRRDPVPVTVEPTDSATAGEGEGGVDGVGGRGGPRRG